MNHKNMLNKSFSVNFKSATASEITINVINTNNCLQPIYTQ